MKGNTSDKIAKTALIIIGVLFLTVCIISFAWVLNSLFGNPFSKNLAEKTALEYIEENYSNEECYIKNISYDDTYNVHIVSSTDEDIDFSLYITESGEITLIEYWKSPNTSATPLTENELKEMYLKAHNLYQGWIGSAKNMDVNWDKLTKIGDADYFEVTSTEIATVDALKTEFSKYFDRELLDKEIDEYYVMHNGKMYGNSILVEGGDIMWQSHNITIKTITDTECVFTITSSFEDSQRELDYKLKLIDGEWKFTDVFHCVSLEQVVLE